MRFKGVSITSPEPIKKKMNNIKRAEYVELYIPTGSTNQNLYFPDLPNLRQANIFGMEVYTSTTLGVSKLNYNVQALAQVKNSLTTLYFEGGEFIKIPTLSLYRSDATNFYGDIPQLSGQTIVWAKSFITLTNSASISSYANASFVYNVYYSMGKI
jgi:hypothetical protein